MTTDDLLAHLVKRDDGPWAEWLGDKVDAGKTVAPARRLRDQLDRFENVRPKRLRIEGRPAGTRGYELAPILAAASRYLSATSATPASPWPARWRMWRVWRIPRKSGCDSSSTGRGRSDGRRRGGWASWEACINCHVNVYDVDEYYMVHDDVWAASGMGFNDDQMLCVGCLERRLGRRLRPFDFTRCPVNDEVWFGWGSARLQDRMKGGFYRRQRGG